MNEFLFNKIESPEKILFNQWAGMLKLGAVNRFFFFTE